MINAQNSVPFPENEVPQSFAPGSSERQELQEKLKELRGKHEPIPLIIGGKEVYTDKTIAFREPHKLDSTIAEVSQADREATRAAIQASLEAKPAWERMPWTERMSIFLRAAELLTTRWRSTMNAATMLGQSKTCLQAEIEAVMELADFLRFNAYYTHQIYSEQPLHNPKGIWNRMEYRPLEGFIYAVTPFNFTAIGGNLPSAPAMLGNVAVWKPSPKSVYANYIFMQILREAGLPDGVINFVPGPAEEITGAAFSSPDFGGLHFTGSIFVFRDLWKKIGNNIDIYKSFPRIVGETGGKDFLVAHRSADAREVATALVRGAFEYQGQKCSAVSRAYIPRELWKPVKKVVEEQLTEVRMGDPCDFTNFVSAVIGESAFDKITGYIERARESKECTILYGGEYSKETGYFIKPTVIETTNPYYESMVEEIFGPVLTVYVYEDRDYVKTLELCDRTSPFGLTGAVFAQDRNAVNLALEHLRYAAGNFYINDKPTGSIVGQQPFGGARLSGTNDKAGSVLNLMRWVSSRSIKENFVPPRDFRYPFMESD